MRWCIALLFIFVSNNSFAAYKITYRDRISCTPDVIRYCQHLTREGGLAGVVACLRENRDKLHYRCRDALNRYEKETGE